MNIFNNSILRSISPQALVANIEAIVRCGREVSDRLIWSNGPAKNGKPPRGLYGTPDDLYSFGLSCLALRAQAVELSRTSYSSTYSKLAKQYDLDQFDAKSRRHSMYFPVLADDDAFKEIILEETERLRWLFDRPLVGTEQIAERIKHLRLSSVAIDWLPFGGAPPKYEE